MRLTLRTLLAYLDGILESEDQDDIARQVEDSEFATQLIHRTRDVVRRMRLGAPNELGSGLAQDPNSVAEYLDNTLAPEQIQAFEKICLESDIHLAEAGSCHHILTMILGEPAQVDPETRERMYSTIDGPPAVVEVPSQEAPESAESPTTAEQGDASRAARQKPEVPDYLRQPQRSLVQRLMIALLVAGILAGGVLMLFEDKIFNSSPSDEETAQKEKAQNENGTSDQDKQSDQKTDAKKNISQPGPKSNTQQTIEPNDSVPGPMTPVGDSTSADDSQPAKKPEVELSVPESSLPGETPLEPTQVVPGADPTVIATEDSTPPAETPTTPGPSTPVSALPTEPKPQAELPSTAVKALPKKDPEPPEPVGIPGVSTVAPTKPSDPESPEEGAKVGFLASRDKMMLRYDAEGQQWRRLEHRGELHVGDVLLALPTFNPQVSLSGAIMDITGGTFLRVASLGEDKVPEIEIQSGRIVIRTLGSENVKLRLKMGSQSGLLSLENGQSTAALEVRPYRPWGADPQKARAKVASTIYATQGEVTWKMGDDENKLTAPMHRVLVSLPGAEELKPDGIPKWVSDPGLTRLQTQASQQISQAIRSDSPVKLSLREQAHHRRAEVRNLAVRCAIYIGHYDLVIDALSDTEYRLGWNHFIDELAIALARDEKASNEILASLARHYDSDAPELHRLLRGYSDQQLKQGDARRLVKFLDDDQLVFRVMSFWNLTKIAKASNLGLLHYRPELTEVKRRPSVARWRKRLNRNELVRKKPDAKSK